MMADTATVTDYKPLFPYFGGKSRIASEVWARLGDPPNVIEPFFGSGAVLFMRPPWSETETRIETVNDADGFVSNFWRALAADSDAVAHHADWPVNENDLHARHAWLVNQRDTMQARLEGDPDWCDVKIAGWWVWGICCWIGSGWCNGEGPWHVDNGLLVRTKGNAGLGVNRQRPHLGDAGHGVNRQLPHLGNAGHGVNRGDDTRALMQWYADRLRNVRVCCGDWARICGDSPTIKHGLTGVFLDPPYSDEAGRDMRCYRCDSGTVAHDVREWAIEHGDNPLFRIALCGYDGEHEMPDGWECLEWRTNGGYGSQGNGTGRANKHRERVWFSPHCLHPGEHGQMEIET